MKLQQKLFCLSRKKRKIELYINFLFKEAFLLLKKQAFYTCFSSDQKGESFGDRITHALDSVFKKGYDKVILLGSDCPFISSKLLLKTSEKLKTESFVLGPTIQGGIYLIGINKNVFCPIAFNQLPWQKSNLQEASEKYALSFAKSIHWLPLFFDINSKKDFQNLLQTLFKTDKLFLQLISIISSFKIHFIYINKWILKIYSKYNFSLRAPPFSSL